MVDLLDMVIPEEQEEQIKQSLEEKTKYKVRIKSRLLESEMYRFRESGRHIMFIWILS